MNAAVIQSMINAIDKPAIYISPDYVIQAVNEAYRDTYTVPVTVGTSRCYQVSHKNTKPCDQHGEACPLQKVQQTGKSASVVHIHSTGSGKQYCDILMKPVKDEDGMTIGFLEILDRIDYAASESEPDKMIGKTEPFKQMLNHINRAAQSDIAVLLQGETGAGKELVAKALHDSSERKQMPFVVIECTGINDNLFESELFGHEKGAFTGATSAKKGLIEEAQGGTIFFDEIADVPLSMQVKLLRLLETRKFRSVGGLKLKQADFRLVSASHKNLLELVKKGEFRADLYYRIAGFPIFLPALRDRETDIPELSKHFLTHSIHKQKHFSDKALKALQRYPFPGNIRELKNIVENAALMANDDEIGVNDLPPHVRVVPSEVSPAENASTTLLNDIVPLQALEQSYLAEICDTWEGSPDELALQLGVSTRTLYRKLQKFGLRLG